LTPIDFFLLIDCPGTDPSHYSVKGYVTNEKFFPNETALREAFNAGELAQEYVQTRDMSWTDVDYKPEMGVRALEERFAPTSLELGGKRYQVDPEAQYVEYMGFSFYIAFSRTLGIMFYDIKYKGDRIMYELSLQEALAQYAGNQASRPQLSIYSLAHKPLAQSGQYRIPRYILQFGNRLGCSHRGLRLSIRLHTLECDIP